MDYFMGLSRRWFRGTDERHEKSHSGRSVFGRGSISALKKKKKTLPTEPNG
jgi:hypothetical protein